MRKILLAIFCFSLFLQGCVFLPSRASRDETLPFHQTSAPEETTEPIPSETIPALEYQNPFTAVSLVPVSDPVTASDGTLLYRVSSADLTLTVEDQQISHAITTDFTRRKEALRAAAHSSLEAASEDYTQGMDWTPLFCDMTYSVSRLDQQTISFIGQETFFDGTDRSGISAISFTYDMHTGHYLTLQDILVPEFSADELISRILHSLEEQTDVLYEDYAESIAPLFAANTPAENWCFTKTGLCFYFSPYEIAPPSQGIVRTEIPYSLLSGLLKDEFFPSETVEFTGDVLMESFENADTSGIVRFAEAVLDPDGKEFLLHSQGTVLDLSVDIGRWTPEGSFYPQQTVFCAQALPQGYALMLQLTEDELSSVCITYQSGNIIMQIPWKN